ncbi:MAG: cell division protein FtsZ [Thermodesulfobacteriota bacterium]|jgi:cell division protein FtsZ
MIQFDENKNVAAKVKAIGIGGGGCNAINTMISSRLTAVQFIAANTDAQALAANKAPIKLQLGAKITKGLGAGANPEIGRKAALEDIDMIRDSLMGADMVFITAGLGGGTGTGGAPIVAEVAKEMGALTVAIVTKPFLFEGKKRMKQAEEGVINLRMTADTLITIPNQRLLTISGKSMSLLEAFNRADDVLLHAAKGISDLIAFHGLINLDFADVRTIMSEMGMALMGTGIASGDNRAVDAAQKAISSPLLEDISIEGAKGLLINVTGDSSMTLSEVNEASVLIQKEAHEDANIIFGAVIDDKMGEEIRVTVIATGFGRMEERMLPHLKRVSPISFSLRDNLEVPTYLRREREKSQEVKPEGNEELPSYDDEQYDIPTFLRKQAD